MLSYNQAYYDLVNKLQSLYDAQEASAIAHELMQYITKLGRMQRLVEKDKFFTPHEQEQYNATIADLLKGRPLQYVIGDSWFMGKQYYVNEHVLIPRPETEELVQWVLDDLKNEKKEISILDIGTGSGSIPISLKLALPPARVSTCDISQAALGVAQQNAKKLGTDITLIEADILNETKWAELGNYDVIITNPPYITLAEKETMHSNVKNYEPAAALFVTNNDPLQFYKAIAAFGLKHLNKAGLIYCELHRDHAIDTQKVFEDKGYSDVEIKKDMNGNWRMLKAVFR